jgi:uncharacterized membrane protein YfcA
MSFGTLIILIIIGLFGGIMSGFIGIGGGVIIVPALIYVIGFPQHMAQGTSLFLMLPPIGILAFMNYYKAGQVNLAYGAIIAVAFILGGYFGSKLSLKLSPAIVKSIFGLVMAYVAFRMIYSGIIELRHDT